MIRREVPIGFETFHVGLIGPAFYQWRCPRCNFTTKPSTRRISGGKGRLRHFKESPECEAVE